MEFSGGTQLSRAARGLEIDVEAGRLPRIFGNDLAFVRDESTPLFQTRLWRAYRALPRLSVSMA